MYREYFGLKEAPFSIAPDPRYLYMSDRHREAFAHLLYGVQHEGGFVLLTGEVGTGKTTVCRCLLEQIPEQTDVAFLFNPKLTAAELLATICDEFGIDYPDGNTSIKIFVDRINEYLLKSYADRRKAVLIIDEAQNLEPEVLEQIRLLTNLETNQRKLLQIIVMGQPELQEKLEQPELRQLSQRITARYHLGPLARHEIEAYVNHRLAVAGMKRPLFSKGGYGKLFSLSNGVPRLINLICDRALLGAYVQTLSKVDSNTIMVAAKEVMGQSKAIYFGRVRKHPRMLYGVMMAAAAGVLIFLISLYQESSTSGIPSGKSRFETVMEKKLLSSLDGELNQDMRDGKDRSVASATANEESAVSLAWPLDKPTSHSRGKAFQALFKAWNIDYVPENDGPDCQFALSRGLQCLDRSGSLEELKKINRPAVLHLINKQGDTYFATVSAIRGQLVTVTLGESLMQVAEKEVARHWHGRWTTLWQPPPNYEDSIRPGHKGPVVEWLAKQLAVYYNHTPVLPEGLVYNEEMVRQVKEFQVSQGLMPDGVAGAQTLIRLQTKSGGKEPALF